MEFLNSARPRASQTGRQAQHIQRGVLGKQNHRLHQGVGGCHRAVQVHHQRGKNRILQTGPPLSLSWMPMASMPCQSSWCLAGQPEARPERSSPEYWIFKQKVPPAQAGPAPAALLSIAKLKTFCRSTSSWSRQKRSGASAGLSKPRHSNADGNSRNTICWQGMHKPVSIRQMFAGWKVHRPVVASA